jgi:hypothetical protein
LDGSSAAGGVLLEPLELEDGVLLEPLDAPELGEELGGVAEPLVEPPAELELEDGGLGGVDALPPDIEPEPDAEPDGLDGVLLEPADDELEPGVLETARSPSVLSQPVSNPAPSARETATAKAESLIVWASVGWGKNIGARFRPDAVPSRSPLP